MGACPTIATARLELRPFREDDTAAYFAVLTQPEVRAALKVPEAFSPYDAWKQLATWVGMWEWRRLGQWAVVERDSGRFVGRAGLHHPPLPDWPGIEVGWVLHPSVWGLGYATEAGAAAVRYARDVLATDEVWSVILPENARSQAVARRLGFTLVEERVLSHFPSAPHGLWRLDLRGTA